MGGPRIGDPTTIQNRHWTPLDECKMMTKQWDLGVPYFQTSSGCPSHLSWNFAPIFLGVHLVSSFPNATLTPKGIEH
jgi:hypothetical protein